MISAAQRVPTAITMFRGSKATAAAAAAGRLATEQAREGGEAGRDVDVCEERPVGDDAGADDGGRWLYLGPEVEYCS